MADVIEANKKTDWACDKCGGKATFMHGIDPEHVFLISDLVYHDHKMKSPLCSLANNIHMGPDLHWETKVE